jgi:hypothetical protein
MTIVSIIVRIGEKSRENRLFLAGYSKKRAGTHSRDCDLSDGLSPLLDFSSFIILGKRNFVKISFKTP